MITRPSRTACIAGTTHRKNGLASKPTWTDTETDTVVISSIALREDIVGGGDIFVTTESDIYRIPMEDPYTPVDDVGDNGYLIEYNSRDDVLYHLGFDKGGTTVPDRIQTLSGLDDTSLSTSTNLWPGTYAKGHSITVDTNNNYIYYSR